MRTLCKLDDIPDKGSRGFPKRPGSLRGLFAIRRGENVRVFVNACPHLGSPLEWVEHRFLDVTGKHIICAHHGALFRVSDGVCTYGPCEGGWLEAVPAQVVEGEVLVPEDAGK